MTNGIFVVALCLVAVLSVNGAHWGYRGGTYGDDNDFRGYSIGRGFGPHGFAQGGFGRAASILGRFSNRFG
ncbi:unnamed protein product [Haemonchus placei]|uniref:Neuropeptide-Like Protein n=1 Tax=Haemonchus placei TaxID=6290 RepID=A0A0N4W4S3_HAEPC|nr:unnamed protein product [Haemonchus placei]